MRAQHVPTGVVSPRTAALLREVAEQLEPQVDGIATTMTAFYPQEIDAYHDGDESLMDDVRVVACATVRLWLTVMASGQDVDEANLTPLQEGARRRAVQGIDLDAVLRAYRLGIRVMWTEITTSPAWNDPELQGGMGAVATWALSFSERICSAVAAAYLDETARLTREREHRRSSLLSLILADPEMEQYRVPPDLSRPHCVAVAKVPADRSLDQLEQIGHCLERQADASLWTVRHASVVSIVPLKSSGCRPAALQQLSRLASTEAIEAFGVGTQASHPTETRQSYLEATDALRFGPRTSHPASPVYDYGELAPIIALLRHPEQAKRFADAALDPWVSILGRKWALVTLEAYLTRQGRVKEIAAVLGVHLNTAKYRLNELRPLLDQIVGNGDHAATLLLSIRVRQYLSLTDHITHSAP